MTEAELGPLVAWSGALVPRTAALEGRYVRLESLHPDRHAAALFEALRGHPADPQQWTYMAYGPFADQDALTAWLWQRAGLLDPIYYAIVPEGRRAAGLATFMRVDPAAGSIEIGHLVFAPALQRTRAATEAIYLMAAHAFEDLNYRRLEWKCHALNERSRRAARRYGFAFEGVFRQARVDRGRNRDTAWFAIVDGDWPRLKAGFEAWLEPSNFDVDGRQKRPLRFG